MWEEVISTHFLILCLKRYPNIHLLLTSVVHSVPSILQESLFSAVPLIISKLACSKTAEKIMATLEIGENEVDHSNIVILLGYTDCSPSIRHCSSSELHIPLCRSTLSYYVLDDPFYHPILIAICLSITSSFSFKRTFHRSK